MDGYFGRRCPARRLSACVIRSNRLDARAGTSPSRPAARATPASASRGDRGSWFGRGSGFACRARKRRRKYTAAVPCCTCTRTVQISTATGIYFPLSCSSAPAPCIAAAGRRGRGARFHVVISCDVRVGRSALVHTPPCRRAIALAIYIHLFLPCLLWFYLLGGYD